MLGWSNSRSLSWSGKKEELLSVSIPRFCRHVHQGFIERVMKTEERCYLETNVCSLLVWTSNIWASVRDCLAGKAFQIGTSSHPWEWLVATLALGQCAAFAYFPESQVGDLPQFLLYGAAITGTILRTPRAGYWIQPSYAMLCLSDFVELHHVAAVRIWGTSSCPDTALVMNVLRHVERFVVIFIQVKQRKGTHLGQW